MAMQDAPDNATTATQCRRILLVEDNIDANYALQMLLTSAGHTVVSAFDGLVGLAMARERVLDVLICDIRLPGIDGFELITQLRRSSNSPIPFAIAISGDAQADDRARAIGAGFGQYLVKPINVDALLTLIGSSVVTSFITTAHKPR